MVVAFSDHSLSTSAETRCFLSLIVLSNVGVIKIPATLGMMRGQFSNMRLYEPFCPVFVVGEIATGKKEDTPYRGPVRGPCEHSEGVEERVMLFQVLSCCVRLPGAARSHRIRTICAVAEEDSQPVLPCLQALE